MFEQERPALSLPALKDRVCPLCNGKGVTLNRVLEGWPSTTLASGEVKRMTPVVRDRLVSCQVCEGGKVVAA